MNLFENNFVLSRGVISRFTVLVLCLFAVAQRASSAEFTPASFQLFLESYCTGCHGEDKPKGGVNLATFSSHELLHRDPKLWETVVRQVRDREMPPQNKAQPSEAEREQFLSLVSTILDNPDPAFVPRDPGHKPPHRLNHLEYQNTILDLLGVEFEASKKFPSDGGGGGGFDNNASTLFVSPLLLERYLAATDEILAKAAAERIYVFKPGLFTSRQAAAEKVIRHFAERAFRRAPQTGEISNLMKIYESGIRDGESHENAIKLSLKRILISPQFIFRIEQDPATSMAERISDHELATRLSYFLWSSMPDDELFRLARRNRLHHPEVLEKQLQRMLRDPKARAFSESFVGQWLHVRDLFTSARPDPKRFPEYSDDLRDSIYREPIELFHFLVTENKSLLDLLDADYSFLNEDIATLYGVQNVKGRDFRRVSLNDPNRGGVMTMPGPLTLTSYALRTSPVLRGKWILEEILGTPPPPPPPAVTSLPEDDRTRKGLTFRQRLEEHRQKPNCISCHQKMDPLGFALENFDPLGRWRTDVAGEPVDATGELSDGEILSSPAELKKAMMQRKDLFARNVTEKMLSYALGRGLEYYDIPTVKKITDAVIKDNYSSRTLLLEIVQSYPFQFRRSEEMELSQK